MTEVNVKPGSKRALSIAVMNANLDKPMFEVVPLLETAASLNTAAAKSMYKWLVENGLAGGKVEKAPRAVKEKVVKAKAEKIVKVKAQKPEKTPEEIEAIKAKNLQRLKDVGKKYAAGKVSANVKTGHSEAWEGEEHARRVVAGEIELPDALDSFKAPEKLTMDEVNALV